jgi:flagellar biosynthetic protein FliR
MPPFMVPDLIHWSAAQFQTLTIVMMRVATLLFMMPLFSGRSLPHLVKIGLVLVVSLVLWPAVRGEISRLPSDPFSFGFLMISELMIGLSLALSVRLILAGIQLAGEFAGIQMGLSMANIIDPQSGTNSTLISEFYYLLSLLIFLSVDGHHWIFRALAQSFHALSPGGIHFQEGLVRHLLQLSGRVFLIAVKLSAPVVVILLLIQFALGIVARMVPQMNILVSSFPLTIGLGLVFLGLSTELLWPYLKALLDESGRGLVMTLLPLMKR